MSQIEIHPFEPYVPDGARFLFLGTFPPKAEKWSMEFFYPNKINDMWRIMGLLFFSDRDHFWNAEERRFMIEPIKRFLDSRRIAMYDTARRVRRLKDNASDKFLDIVQTIDLCHFFYTCPSITAVVTAGEKATAVVAQMSGVQPPKMGEAVECELAGHAFTLYRMPSSSRAFPMALEKKAEAYRKMFRKIGYDI